MKNKYLDKFMARFEFEGLTFDDVSLSTRYADFLPEEANISAQLSTNVFLKVPFVSAAMDTVTEKDMAIAMAMSGGIGIVHKNLTPREQAEHVAVVKHHLHGLIRDPVVFRSNETIAEVLERKETKGFSFSGFPVLDDTDKLVGILTGSDIKFASDNDRPVSEVMTSDVISAAGDTSLSDAYALMKKNKIGKLPLVDNGVLVGLYSFSDVRALVEEADPMINRDSKYRLRVGAAIGPHDEERIELLAAQQTDVIVIDTAHGHSKGVMETIRKVKKAHPEIDVIAGNIATADAAKELRDAGADAVKVGIGPGSICTTRVVAGVGVPQVTAIYNCSKALEDSIPIIADGGIRHSGDVPKALVSGASTVMVGSILAGTEESPGEKIIHQGRRYVVYRGMGSLGAMREGEGSRSRYLQNSTARADLVPQGVEGIVPYVGKLRDVMVQYCGGLRASLGYCGCRDISELRADGEYVRVSLAGLNEAHPHDVRVMKEAPNYRQG